MNTANDREWGAGVETAKDFDITKIKPEQWVKAVKDAGITGVILTCKHHDGFCLWDTKYTDFNVMNTKIHTDIVKAVADACYVNDIDFGVYLSPWDMHEPCYATPEYNDYFVNQLTELLTNYGEIFEVWFDGAKGANAKAFTYDWKRYYETIHKLQPKANIAICGEDIRWVGNEAGKARKMNTALFRHLSGNANPQRKTVSPPRAMQADCKRLIQWMRTWALERCSRKMLILLGIRQRLMFLFARAGFIIKR